MDRITLSHIVACGRHGADPGERDRTQPFHIDVVLDIDLTKASKSDALKDTVNYAELYREIVEIVETHSYELLERLAGEVATTILRESRVQCASVTIAKPRLLDGATPSVTLVRSRS